MQVIVTTIITQAIELDHYELEEHAPTGQPITAMSVQALAFDLAQRMPGTTTRSRKSSSLSDVEPAELSALIAAAQARRAELEAEG